MKHARFNSGAFAAGSCGAAALLYTALDHFRWQLDVRIGMLIAVLVGLLLAFEVTPPEKRKPEL